MNDRERKTQLFLQHQDMLAEYIHALVAHSADADDVFQETAMAILHNAPEIPGDPARFPAWARGVARNKALRHWRTKKKDRLVPDTRIVEALGRAYEEADSNDEIWRQRRSLLKACLNRLAPLHRKILDLFYAQELKTRQISAMIQRKDATVRMILRRVRIALSECIQTGMTAV